jgi:hypothetical protein
MWVPVAFEKSFQMAYSRTRYGTGYYIYKQYLPGAKLSHPIRAWDGKTPPDADVLELIGKSGSDLSPGGAAAAKRSNVHLRPGKSEVLAEITGPSMVRRLHLAVPRQSAVEFSHVRLRVTWDRRAEPSIDAPVGLFFGAGVLYNRDGREFLVKALPMTVRFDDAKVQLACYFPMPFFQSARFELVSEAADISGVESSISFLPLGDSSSQVGYFHATSQDFPSPELGRDMVLLDTQKAEGGGDWSGSFVGTSFIFSHNANLNTLEGDPRFYFDDSNTPQGQGTGTEEWGGGGDYWGGRNMTLPFAGHPCGARSPKEAVSELDKIESAYRFLLADLMPFGKNARIMLEHGGTNESSEHYQTVTYWYGRPKATLVKTDEFQVGDAADEAAHHYQSPQAGEPYSITSRYEWGVDTLKGKEIYPPHTDRGRTTTGASEFTLKLDPNNIGVLLRRKLDYSFPNQRAEVFIADASAPGDFQWEPAGVWYLAGSNTCVYSDPKEELGATQHHAQSSNRRFRDDEFLIGRGLTENRSAIRIRVKFTPVNIPLFPSHPLPELAWSEMRYTAYCFRFDE